MYKAKEGRIYTYWSGPSFPENIQRCIENNVKINQHVYFVLCYHNQYLPREWDAFIKRLSKKYENFHIQDIFANDVLKPEEQFLTPEYVQMINLIASLSDTIIKYINEHACDRKDPPDKRRQAFIKDFVQVHVLRNKNTVWLDANVFCNKAIDMNPHAGFKQAFVSVKAIVVGSDNGLNYMMDEYLLDMITFSISFYKKNKSQYNKLCSLKIEKQEGLLECITALIIVPGYLLAGGGIFHYAKFFEAQLLKREDSSSNNFLKNQPQEEKFIPIKQKNRLVLDKLKDYYIFREEMVILEPSEGDGEPSNMEEKEFRQVSEYAESNNFDSIRLLVFKLHYKCFNQLIIDVINISFRVHYIDDWLKDVELGLGYNGIKNAFDIRSWLFSCSHITFETLYKYKKILPEYEFANMGRVNLQCILNGYGDLYGAISRLYINKRAVQDPSEGMDILKACKIPKRFVHLGVIFDCIFNNDYPSLNATGLSNKEEEVDSKMRSVQITKIEESSIVATKDNPQNKEELPVTSPNTKIMTEEAYSKIKVEQKSQSFF